MSLPMFEPKRIVTMIMAKRGDKNKAHVANEPNAPEGGHPLKGHMQDMLAAMESKSADKMAEAFHAAMLACGGMVDDDGDGDNDNLNSKG